MTGNAAAPKGPELVIALVGAIGTDLAVVQDVLVKRLEGVAYEAVPISMIEKVRDYVECPRFDDANLFIRYMARMDAGDAFRKKLGRHDAVALLGLAAIRAERRNRTGEEKKAAARHAFVLKSLKNPKEIETLRSTYGKNCFVISAYGPRHLREKQLASRIAGSLYDADVDRHRPVAQQLIHRDDAETGIGHGQNVRDTFPLADAFVDASTRVHIEKGISPIIDLLFGHPWETPTRMEYGMFHAQGAALRSASAARQVGAAILTPEADVLALGTNEVAKPGGGQCWGEDGPENDLRDHTRPKDPTSSMIDGILADLLARAKKHHWLAPDRAMATDDELVQAAHAGAGSALTLRS